MSASSPDRPARAPLSAGRIHAAALALIDEHGTEGLTMRRLAAVLGVDPMSIYHHVPGKQALLQGVYQAVLEELAIPRRGSGGWQAVLRELARRFLALARRHPRVVPALLASPQRTAREREIHAAIDTCLVEAGFGVEDRFRLARAIYTYATGLAGVAAREPAAELEFSIDLMIAGIETLAQRATRG
ncbi:MAG TPA: TetR family transcriptional regulator [Quisquiliibacterium sp.]|nr:TetR family transcriptional regulator [Quisquiliibacterium sp.]